MLYHVAAYLYKKADPRESAEQPTTTVSGLAPASTSNLTDMQESKNGPLSPGWQGMDHSVLYSEGSTDVFKSRGKPTHCIITWNQKKNTDSMKMSA